MIVGVTVALRETLPNAERSSVTLRAVAPEFTCTTVAVPSPTAATLEVSFTCTRWSPGRMKCVKFRRVSYFVLV